MYPGVQLAFLFFTMSSLKITPCYFWLLIDSHCHFPLGEKHSFFWCVYFSAEKKMIGLMSPEEWTQRRLFTLGSPTQQLWRVWGWRAGSYYLNRGMRQSSPATNSQVDLLQMGLSNKQLTRSFVIICLAVVSSDLVLLSLLILCMFRDSSGFSPSASTGWQSASARAFPWFSLGLSSLTLLFIELMWVNNHYLFRAFSRPSIRMSALYTFSPCNSL